MAKKCDGMLKWASIFVALSFITVIVPHRAATGISPPVSGSSSPLPELLDFNAASETERIILNIDGALMAGYIQRLQDFKTRYAYRSDVCFDAAEYINSHFERNGLSTYYDDFTYQGWKMRNVVGFKPGTSSSNGTVIICAHYDSITPGSYPMTSAPGADDNGSGVAAVMAAAEILSDYDFNLTIKFIAFSGEELGLKGSYNYRNKALASGENITAVINLDMIANNPDPGSGLVKLFIGNGVILQPVKLLNAINETAAMFGHTIGITPYLAGTSGSSDHQPFAYYYESIFFHEEIFSGVYHSTQDTIGWLNMTYCANVTQLAVASLAKVAEICGNDASPPAHTPGFPAHGTYAPAIPTISIEATDPDGIDAASLALTVNGIPVSPDIRNIPMGCNISYSPIVPFPDSAVVNVSVFVADAAGNNFTHSWSFIADAIPPEPPSNLTISASRISLNKQGMVLDYGSPWDLKHALSPSVIYHDGEYKMWYMASNSTRYHINYANSSDGLEWVKHGTVMLYTEAGQPDYVHVGYPSVLYDGEYKMWFSANNGTAWQIMYANSSDGISWAKQGIVMAPGQPGSLDAANAFSASVIGDGGGYRMWYTGSDLMKYSILEATSPDGLSWTKTGSSVVAIDEPGTRWGDANIAYPRVVRHNNAYHMWYNRLGQNSYQTHYATSSDGSSWNDMGLAIPASVSLGTRDRFQATYCSILLTDMETKVWYSGYDGTNWRIMFANISLSDPAADLTLSWTPSPSSDVVRYEVFRESRPSAFSQTLERASPEYYVSPSGQTPWTFEKAGVANATVYGPVAGSDPSHFLLPDDNIIDLGLYLRTGSGSWQKLVGGSDYGLDHNLGSVDIISAQFTAGCSLHAWYNHSAGRALRTTGTSLADTGSGLSGVNYYYVVRAVDRAGNAALSPVTVGKIAAEAEGSWGLFCNPFLAGPAPVGEVLGSLDWSMARTWDPERLPNHWTMSMPGRTGGEDSLLEIDAGKGFWVKSLSPGNYIAFGQVRNVSISLLPGWNLVAYPYHEIMSVSRALEGIPWDRVEVFSSSSPGLLTELTATDLLVPGYGLWVHVASDAVWNAVNVP